jgi:fumarylacetoacetase
MIMNVTTDPALRSFIPVIENSHFPIQNLPYGVFKPNALSKPRIGVAIGDFILDLSILEAEGFFANIFGKPSYIFAKPSLNTFMSQGVDIWRETRAIISNLLRADEPRLRDNENLRRQVLIPVKETRLLLPVEIGGYTDFYSSREHATNVGTMFRGKENALMLNWLHLPVAYHGRTSSIVLSGTDIRRPQGQSKSDDVDQPSFGPSKLLDFELEMGFFIGTGNELGRPIPVAEAENHIFGLVLVNDWSARDIQKWEYQPLGPFLAKNFATSISPWVVTLEALEPFRSAGPQQNPQPLPYLVSDGEHSFNIDLEVSLRSPTIQNEHVICRSNFRYLYWSMRQQLAHHSISGCNLQTGDLLASGTISGPDPDSYGSMLELAWRGTKPIELPDGSSRKFLADEDTVIMRGWCAGDAYRVGFGEVIGKILPSVV